MSAKPGHTRLTPAPLGHGEHLPSGSSPADNSHVGKRICICVDDYGMSKAISTAALQLVNMRRVHAFGCMVGAPMWRAWCGQARELPIAGVDTGLHLDLTEFPLLASTRKPLAHWIGGAYMHRLDRAAVRAEICAQLDAFEDAMGRPPAYVDGHQHVHQLPVVRAEMVAEMVLRYTQDTAAMPWLRATRVASGTTAQAHGGWAGWAKSHTIAALGASGLATLARRHGIRQNSTLQGVYGFNAQPAQYLQILAAALRTAGDAALVMCHPSGQHDAQDAIGAARLIEYGVLRSPELGQLVQDAGLDLQPMSRILAK
nr:ChbG/HpnK family deacetylase [uncultured Albidiferax sp.]